MTCAGSLFHTVTDFSAREVGSFGAPSLITRITNDVQQVQLMVVMALHHGDRARRSPSWSASSPPSARTSVCPPSSLFSIPVAAVVLGLIVVGRMVPAFRLMQVRIDQINRVLREQITGIRVVRAFVREPEETGALRHAATPS